MSLLKIVWWYSNTSAHLGVSMLITKLVQHDFMDYKDKTLPSRFLFFLLQLLSCVQLFATLCTAVCQASLSSTILQSLLKFMSIESTMLSNHLILCCPLLLLPSVFSSIRVFSSELALCQSIGASAWASVLPMNIQGWFPLGLTGLISLQSKGLLRVFSSTKILKHQFFSPQLSLWSNSHIHTWLLEKPYRLLVIHISCA